MKNRLIFILLLWGSLACSSYRIERNEFDKKTDWTSYRTFTFIDTNRIDDLPSEAYLLAMEQVKQAIAEELKSRGYQQISSSEIGVSADLLINIGGVVNEKTQIRQTSIYEAPRYIGQRRYHWQSEDVPVGTYKEGTINLHVVDARRTELLWDVAVSSVLRKGNVTPEQVQEGVKKMFTKFPGNRS